MTTTHSPATPGAEPAPDTAAVLRRSLIELGIDEDAITADARLREDLELDSTEIVQVSLELTRHCGTRIKLESDSDPSFREVCDLVAAAVRS
jgi:acyl carrier protein